MSIRLQTSFEFDVQEINGSAYVNLSDVIAFLRLLEYGKDVGVSGQFLELQIKACQEMKIGPQNPDNKFTICCCWKRNNDHKSCISCCDCHKTRNFAFTTKEQS